MSLQPSSSKNALIKFEDDEADDEDVEVKVPESPVIPAPSCPWYEEIKKYLFANRDPLELALDTMRILPETTFYRYIHDYGGIELTARELRSFLCVASNDRELFL